MANLIIASMSIKEVGQLIGFFNNHWYFERYNNSTPDLLKVVYKFYGGWYDEEPVNQDKVLEAFEKDGWTAKWYESYCSAGDGYVLCFQFSKSK